MADSVIHTSFAGGELSPNLFARVDLEKFQVGAALLRNFYVDFRGGATIRPGTQFCARCKSTVAGLKRAVRFVVSTTAAYVLEFGHQYIRYYFDGALLAGTPLAITGASATNPVVLNVVNALTNGAEVYISGVVGMTQLNRKNFLVANRTGTTFELHDLDGNAVDGTAFAAYVSGGTAAPIYETVTPYAEADLPLLKFTQSADVLTIVHQSYAPRNLTRLTASTFSLAAIVIGPQTSPPSNLGGSATDSGLYRYSYVVTAVSLDGKEESLPCAPVIIESEPLNEADHKTIYLTWTASADPTSVYRVYKSGPTDNGRSPQSVWGFCGQAKGTTFGDLNYAPDFTKTPPEFTDPFTGGQITSVTITADGAGYTGYYENLVITGDGTGAAGLSSIEQSSGNLVAAWITLPGAGYTTASGTAGAGGATFSFTFSALTPAYPACVTYFQQRRVFGEPFGQPETAVFSQIGNYDNFDKGLVVLDSDAFTMSIASREVNKIVSLVPMSGGMIAFTSGGAFLISGQSASDAITPATAVALPQASSGASDLPPLVINNNVIYITSKGNTVRDLEFNFGVQSYYGKDRSTLANHLFQGFTILDWTWAEEPQKLVWAVRSDGKLLCLSYVPEEDVYGWSRHDTYGLFESATSIPEGEIDRTYLIVQRQIGGVWKQFMERFTPGNPAAVEDAWQVDSGIAYPLDTPDATLTFAAASGSGVTVRASASVFVLADVGDVIWAGGGQATVANYVSGTEIKVNFVQPLLTVLDDGTPLPVPAGWEIGTPTTNISGLDHLAGMANVSVLADGIVMLNQAVAADGTLVSPLPWPSTKIVAGLPFQAQLQTLNLEVNGVPTLQGRRKTIVAVTTRMLKARGLQAGQEFDALVPIKDLAVPLNAASPLVTDDIRTILPNAWIEEGRMCFQQDYPLPATILGLIPEVLLGDTSR